MKIVTSLLFSMLFFVNSGYSSDDDSIPLITQEEVDTTDEIGFGESKYLKANDIVLKVIIYKYVDTDQGKIRYAKVVESLRGDIPVESLIKWSFDKIKLPAGSEPKILIDNSLAFCYVIASSNDIDKVINEELKEFEPADKISGVPMYEFSKVASYFPAVESDPGRAMKRLVREQPARIVEESEAAKYQQEEQ